MTHPPQTTHPGWLRWAGWLLTVLPAGMLLMSGVMKITASEEFLKQFAQSGFPTSVAVPLGIVEIACTILYLIPQTSVVGAILLTGYMGGAIATHVRLGDAFYIQSAIGVVIWLGIFFREPRLWPLMPIRKL